MIGKTISHYKILEKLKMTATFCFLPLIVWGCSSSQVLKLYQGPEKPKAELAILTGSKDVEVINIYDSDYNELTQVDPYVDFWLRECHLLPGKYNIEARYNKNDGIRISLTRNQIVTLEAEAGKVYELVAHKGDDQFTVAILVRATE